MTNYRRFYIPGATGFFTVNLAKHRGNHLLVENIGLLRAAFHDVKKSRAKRRERGIWQRRFWAHLITDQDDFNRHADIHWNPVKHGWVRNVADWPYSSFRKFVRLGIYPYTWGHSGEFDFDAGE